jgi:hypothetical protein
MFTASMKTVSIELCVCNLLHIGRQHRITAIPCCCEHGFSLSVMAAQANHS